MQILFSWCDVGSSEKWTEFSQSWNNNYFSSMFKLNA